MMRRRRNRKRFVRRPSASSSPRSDRTWLRGGTYCQGSRSRSNFSRRGSSRTGPSRVEVPYARSYLDCDSVAPAAHRLERAAYPSTSHSDKAGPGTGGASSAARAHSAAADDAALAVVRRELSTRELCPVPGHVADACFHLVGDLRDRDTRRLSPDAESVSDDGRDLVVPWRTGNYKHGRTGRANASGVGR